MKKVNKRLNKTERYFLILNTIVTLVLAVYLFMPDLFTQSFWSIKLAGLKTPVPLILNFLFLLYWLWRARFYFLISLLSIALYSTLLIQKNGWEDVKENALGAIMVPNNQIDPNQTDYIGNKPDLAEHPRLLWSKESENKLKQVTAADAQWSKLNGFILKASTALLSKKLKTHLVRGEFVVDDSRESLRRLFFLSYSWRITHDEKYLNAAKADMLTLAAVRDWQPLTYTNTADIVIGVSIAFDWLYKDLIEEDRITIQKALLEKGLNPSLDLFYNYWLDEVGSRNQICNAAMIYGALAIYDYSPKFAKQLINRSIGSLSNSMAVYAPNGFHPSGYQVGSNATAVTIMAISALESLYGQDFGLSQKTGFLKAGSALANLMGPTGLPFNYGDGEPRFDLQPVPALYWFANRTKDASLLWSMDKLVAKSEYADLMNNKLLPAVLVWGTSGANNAPQQPSNNVVVEKGANALALMRTSWTDPNALFVGFKGGSASPNGAHMDIGSFVLDAGGKRWVTDLGGDNLANADAKGVNVADMSQGSRRWDIFRNNNKSHSTLTVNNDYQQVNATADITRSSADNNFMGAVANLSGVYNGSLQSAKRGVAIVDNKYVLVRDEIETLDGDNSVRWKIMTPAAVKITSDNTAELSQEGKTFYLRVIEPLKVKLETWSAANRYDYETTNPGKILLGFEVKNEKKEKVVLTVVLSDDNGKIMSVQNVKALSDWPGK